MPLPAKSHKEISWRRATENKHLRACCRIGGRLSLVWRRALLNVFLYTAVARASYIEIQVDSCATMNTMFHLATKFGGPCAWWSETSMSRS